jgi:hypothetical protein
MTRIAVQWAGWTQALEPLRRGPGGFRLFGPAACCCLVVVAAVVVVVVLLARRRRP